MRGADELRRQERRKLFGWAAIGIGFCVPWWIGLGTITFWLIEAMSS